MKSDDGPADGLPLALPCARAGSGEGRAADGCGPPGRRSFRRNQEPRIALAAWILESGAPLTEPDLDWWGCDPPLDQRMKNFLSPHLLDLVERTVEALRRPASQFARLRGLGKGMAATWNFAPAILVLLCLPNKQGTASSVFRVC